jgi:hypothetical protein
MQTTIDPGSLKYSSITARFLIRRGKREVVEGTRRTRIVVIEFKDYATAIGAITHPSTPKQLKSVRAVLWQISLSLMAITVRSQRTCKRCAGCSVSVEWRSESPHHKQQY